MNASRLNLVCIPNTWRRKWQPTPVFLPGESHGQRSLAGYSPWGRKKSDTTERLTQFSEVNKLCHVNHLDKKQLLLWIRHTANIVKYRSWTVVQYNFVVFHIIIVKKIPPKAYASGYIPNSQGN